MSSVGDFFLGMGAAIGGGAVLIGLAISLTNASQKAGFTMLAAVGAIQLLYLIPLYRNAKKNMRAGMMAGIIVGGSLVFLFCAGCGGLLLLSNTN